MDHPEQDKPSTARRVGVADFRDDVAGYLRQVRDGASFVITADGAAVAELRPRPSEAHAKPEPIAATPEPASESPRGLVGSMRGKVWMADEWDTWPEGFVEEMTEGPISSRRRTKASEAAPGHPRPIAEDATLMPDDHWMPSCPVPVISCSA